MGKMWQKNVKKGKNEQKQWQKEEAKFFWEKRCLMTKLILTKSDKKL